MSSDEPIVLAPFCEDFQQIARPLRTAYVVRELKRIDREGLPILRTVLACPDDDAQSLATLLLHSNVGDDGDEIIAPRAWRLRLVADAAPPKTDPQGRLLSADKRGKVLVVKTGNKGARLAEDAPSSQTDAHSGPRRTVSVRAGRDLYELQEVTATPRTYSLRNAILILRQWGVGVTYERARVEPDKDSNPVVVQVNWLVEEVLEARESAPVPTTVPEKRKAA